MYCLLCLALFTASPSTKSVENKAERHYMVVFSSQRTPRNPNFSHTFATFVRVGIDGSIQQQTISWLPEKMPVRVQAALSERGRNYGLDETIQAMQAAGERVSAWGPYEIRSELFNRATVQIEHLNSGAVRYKAFDGFHRTDRVSNCIHAVSAISRGHRLRVLSPGWGDTASYFVLGTLEPWIVNPHETHDWVAKGLGLDSYSIAYRKTFERSPLPSMTGLPLVVRDGRPVPTHGPPDERGSNWR